MTGPLPGVRNGASADALLRAVYNEHGQAVLAYATKLTGDRAAGEDVLQETLVRAWRHSEVLVNGKGSVRAWLLTVAGRIVVDRARMTVARPTEVAESSAQLPMERDHADQVIDSMDVFEALQKLSEEHRQVIVVLYFRGCSLLEASTALGVPEGTIKSRSYYALRALRKSFLTGRLRVASWYCSEPYDRSARKVASAGGGGWRSSRRGWLRSSALAQAVLRLDGAPSVKQLLRPPRCQLKRGYAY